AFRAMAPVGGSQSLPGVTAFSTATGPKLQLAMSEAAREAAPHNATIVKSCCGLFIPRLLSWLDPRAPNARHTTSAIVESPSLHAIEEGSKQTFFLADVAQIQRLGGGKSHPATAYCWYGSTLTRRIGLLKDVNSVAPCGNMDPRSGFVRFSEAIQIAPNSADEKSVATVINALAFAEWSACASGA